MSRGQIISGDFMISIAIFIVIVSIVIPLFGRLSEDMREQQLNDDLQTRIFFVTDALLKTRGMPEDWNQTNAGNIGLADENGRINKTKIRNLMNMDSDQAKNIMGLGGMEFNLSFYSSGYRLMTGAAASPAAYFYRNENGMLAAVNSSGIVWDMYYGGPGSPAESDARSVYAGAAAPLFDQMTGNSTLYKTIIVENPGLVQADINMTALENFLELGGILVYVGDPGLISSGFLMHANASSNTTGIARDSDMIQAPYGSDVYFNNSGWYVFRTSEDAELRIGVESSMDAGGAFMGQWNYGLGEIYYMADMEGSANGINLANAANLVGAAAEITTGTIAYSVVDTRAVIFNTRLNSLGNARMVVGR